MPAKHLKFVRIGLNAMLFILVLKALWFLSVLFVLRPVSFRLAVIPEVCTFVCLCISFLLFRRSMMWPAFAIACISILGYTLLIFVGSSLSDAFGLLYDSLPNFLFLLAAYVVYRGFSRISSNPEGRVAHL